MTANENRLHELRMQYEHIRAPEELNQRLIRMQTEYKAKKHFEALKTWSLRSAACFFCAIAGLTIAANSNAAAAQTLQKIPVIGPIAKIVTFRSYTSQKYGTDANITTPHITGLGDKNIEEKLNGEFEQYADTLIAQYEADIKGMENGGHESVTSSYRVLVNSDLQLTVAINTVIARGDSMEINRYYNIDKETGKILSLNSLFKKNADYVKPINEYISKEIAKNPDDYFSDQDKFSSIAKDQEFYISKDGKLVIVFDEASIAPAYLGTVNFTIPTDVLSGILQNSLLR